MFLSVHDMKVHRLNILLRRANEQAFQERRACMCTPQVHLLQQEHHDKDFQIQQAEGLAAEHQLELESASRMLREGIFNSHYVSLCVFT